MGACDGFSFETDSCDATWAAETHALMGRAVRGRGGGLLFARHMAHNNGQMAHAASVTPPAATPRAIGAVRKGLPAGQLTKMAQLLAVDRSLLLRILGVSQRTMQRKQVHAARLSPAASDRLSRIDRIYTLAVETFGDGEKAAQWLKRPSRRLANELPLKLLDTDAGAQQVERELRQIQYGFVY
jgi:putative toxin-antitoxin system antitoxin component (TIGR02293 family)